MKPLNQLELAQLKHEMREMYKQEGMEVCFQALFEMIVGAQTLLEVLEEENESTD